MRLIDADALLKHEVEAYRMSTMLVVGKGYILDAPTIDVAPVVRGKWIAKHHTISLDNMTLTGTYPTCSLCGYAWIGVAKNTNYCPNCGAKMEDKS